jgi:hypothetical protein
MTILNADQWLYTQLTTDSVLAAALDGRVYIDIAGCDTYPLAVLQQYAMTTQIGNLSNDKVMDSEFWQITVWDNRPSYDRIGSVADRIRSVLHKASGAGVLGAVYQGSQRQAEQEGDVHFRGIVLEFELFTQ